MAQAVVTLIILATLSVERFKEQFNTDTLKVIRNPKNDKLFVVDDQGETLGAVSQNFDMKVDNAEFIQCRWSDMKDKDDPIWVLHNINDDNVELEF